MAYYELVDSRVPLSDQRADYRHAAQMALFANAWRDAKKHPQGFTPTEFLPPWSRRDDDEEPTDEAMLDTVRVINAQFGGSVTRRAE